MSIAFYEAWMAAETGNRSCPWPEQSEHPSNATIPPFDNGYREIQQLLSTRREPKPRVDPVKPDYPPLERKSGTEPGWLPDDELTGEWLKYVEEYRSACDDSDLSLMPSS
jgi:hypothetical protein